MKTQNSFKTILSVLLACILIGLISAPAAQAQDEEGSMILSAMDNERDGVWTVVENQHGAEKRAELQHNYRESVDQNWSYMFRRVADLSHSGTE